MLYIVAVLVDIDLLTEEKQDSLFERQYTTEAPVPWINHNRKAGDHHHQWWIYIYLHSKILDAPRSKFFQFHAVFGKL